ncbi:hypothetical protein BDV96DRAFT_381625 [Lophiotrema nucula]|uniref:Dpy-30 motif-domain-containing protein n=1 Tax=Lophiotrema nucula TaxID=690887 RepID=A0A6A5ZHB2_9PLEO|nr:hypothetical protein BDV96DRAFT_381625 [Lophiotrema nucula]
MAEPSPNPAPAIPEAPIPDPITPIPNGTPIVEPAADVEMAESHPELPPNPFQSPPHITHTTASTPTPAAPPAAPTPTPQPAAVNTPTRNSPHPQAKEQSQAPTVPNMHGSPTRVYLNQNVTPHLLEAMKHLVTQEPDKPLKWLSEFLAQKSLEIEGP